MKLFLRLARKHSLWLWFTAIILFLVALRVPNFSEPYWYGDEAIYLTIGNGLRQGKLLYKEIIDHKTPIIYYLATTPSQNWFRLLNLGWMIATTGFFFSLTLKWTKNKFATVVSTLGFVIMTSLPWFEGHIPNGELFVMGFVLAGLVLISKTNLSNYVFTRTTKLEFANTDLLFSYFGGFLLGLGILTKVPAVLDLAAMGTIWWLFILKFIFKPQKNSRQTWLSWLKLGLALAVGVLTPIVLSVGYFWYRGSLAEYIEFGLLYNFRYAASWDPGVTHPLAVFYTSLLGKLSFVLGTLVVITLLHRKISPLLGFSLVWLMFAFMAATLSNRPYPHYFMQIMPPALMILASLITDIQNQAKDWLRILLSSGLSLMAFGFMSLFLVQLNLGLYDTQTYYVNYWRMINGQISSIEYRNSFNYLMNDNYQAAEIINQSGPEEIFVWGTNPMLYALTNSSPTGRFTVAFHIHDFSAYQETLEDLQAKYPEFVVVMKSESDLVGLNDYLTANYSLHSEFDHFWLFRRQIQL